MLEMVELYLNDYAFYNYFFFHKNTRQHDVYPTSIDYLEWMFGEFCFGELNY